MKVYERIRFYKNGLVAVSVERESCGGCFAKIPPQIQIDIDAEKRVTTCYWWSHFNRITESHRSRVSNNRLVCNGYKAIRAKG